MKTKKIRYTADLENQFIYKVMARKGAKTYLRQAGAKV